MLGAILGGAGLLGKLFGGAAKGSADQRASENTQTSQRNALLAQLYGMNQNAQMNALQSGSAEKLAQGNQELDQRKLALTAPSVRAGQSVRGSIMQNAQPVTLSGLPDRISSRIPTISGGLSPALFNADTRALGGELTRKALIDQLKGDEFAPMERTNFQSGVLPQPKLEDFQQSGLLEKILGGLGLAGSAMGAAGEARDAFGAGRNRRVGYDPNDEAGWG